MGGDGDMLPTAPEETMPLVSVLMPAYNHADYVREAILSVANQIYPNIKLIIIDDGSKDETGNVIESTINELDREFRVVFQSQQNAGICETLNRALALA